MGSDWMADILLGYSTDVFIYLFFTWRKISCLIASILIFLIFYSFDSQWLQFSSIFQIEILR
jgi:hypothetical protein